MQVLAKKGEIHIASLRFNGNPKATIELHIDPYSIDKDGKLRGEWRVLCFNAFANGAPSDEDKAAWAEFEALVESGSVKLCRYCGITPEGKLKLEEVKIDEASRTAGFNIYDDEALKYSLSGILTHYKTRVVSNRRHSSTVVPLIDVDNPRNVVFIEMLGVSTQ